MFLHVGLDSLVKAKEGKKAKIHDNKCNKKDAFERFESRRQQYEREWTRRLKEAILSFKRFE